METELAAKLIMRHHKQKQTTKQRRTTIARRIVQRMIDCGERIQSFRVRQALFSPRPYPEPEQRKRRCKQDQRNKEQQWNLALSACASGRQ
jgi:hypothetical protein